MEVLNQFQYKWKQNCGGKKKKKKITKKAICLRATQES